MGTRQKVFLGLLFAASMVNMAQFLFIEKQTSARYSALNRNPTSNVIDLGHQQSPDFRQRFSLHYNLAGIAPDSQIILPTNSPASSKESVARFLTFGKAQSIHQKVYDHDAASVLPPHLSKDSLHDPTAEGTAPFTVYVVPEKDVDRKRGMPWTIVADNHENGARPATRKFVAFLWGDSKEDRHILLIESSLLPEDMRKEIEA